MAYSQEQWKKETLTKVSFCDIIKIKKVDYGIRQKSMDKC